MAYVKTVWENTPSTDTPINDDNLNHIEDGIEDLDLGKINNDGWIPFPTTLTYSSADSPTGGVTTGADTRSYLSEGMKIKYDQDESLTAYYPLDSNSNASVGGINGTDTNVSYTTGKFGNAWTGNGTSSKTVLTDNAIFKPTGAFTIGCWIKTNSTGDRQIFWSRAYDGSKSQGIRFQISANKITYDIARFDGSVETNGNIVGTTTVTDNNWHYVVVTYNNNYGQLYLDGKLEAENYMPVPSYFATNYVRIGNRILNGVEDSYFNGQIDDLFIINGYALDEQTIKAKYLQGTAQGTGNITVTKMAFLSDNPTINSLSLYHGTDFMLSNSAITNIYYSNVKSPYGFNNNNDKWSILIKNTTSLSQSSPSSSTWYNLGSLKIDVPIGNWKLGYFLVLGGYKTSATSFGADSTLSTSSSSESDTDFHGTTYIESATATLVSIGNIYKEKNISVTSKTPYYLIGKSSGTALTFFGNMSPTKLFAVCNYL